MDKGIGFNRNIFLPWLEAAARFRLESDSPQEMRERLEDVVGERIKSAENRRKAIDILINIWVHSREVSPALHDEAVERLAAVNGPEQRLALHYGLVLLAYPFFRETAAVVGQLGRRGSRISSGEVKRRLTATRGQLGSLAFDHLASLGETADKSALYLPGALILAGFGAKAGMFPLHVWLPKAHPVAPAPASALLSGILTKVGIFGILVISTRLFFGNIPWGNLLLGLGLINMFLGALLALFSVDLKRTID